MNPRGGCRRAGVDPVPGTLRPAIGNGARARRRMRARDSALVSGVSIPNAMDWRRYRRCAASLLVAGLLLGVPPRGDTGTVRPRGGDAGESGTPPRPEDRTAEEYAVKAACVYNFVCYTEWPAKAFVAPEAPLVVAVKGDDAIFAAFKQAFADKQKDKRRISVRRARSADDARGAHVVFVARAEEGSLAAVLAATGAVPCLVVGDTTAVSRRGGAIGFFLEEKRLRFEINLPVVQAAGLTVSSRLLKLGRVVEKEG